MRYSELWAGEHNQCAERAAQPERAQKLCTPPPYPALCISSTRLFLSMGYNKLLMARKTLF